jgi:cell shape-determining protein MreC
MFKKHLIQILSGIIIIILGLTLLMILENRALRSERDMIAGGHVALQKEIANLEREETSMVKENNTILKDLQKQIGDLKAELKEYKGEKK